MSHFAGIPFREESRTAVCCVCGGLPYKRVIWYPEGGQATVSWYCRADDPDTHEVRQLRALVRELKAMTGAQ